MDRRTKLKLLALVLLCFIPIGIVGAQIYAYLVGNIGFSEKAAKVWFQRETSGGVECTGFAEVGGAITNPGPDTGTVFTASTFPWVSGTSVYIEEIVALEQVDTPQGIAFLGTAYSDIVKSAKLYCQNLGAINPTYVLAIEWDNSGAVIYEWSGDLYGNIAGLSFEIEFDAGVTQSTIDGAGSLTFEVQVPTV